MTIIRVVVYREEGMAMWSAVWRARHGGQCVATYPSRARARAMALAIAQRQGCCVHELLPGGSWRVL